MELTTWYGFLLNLHAYTVYMNLPHSIEKSCWFQLVSPSFTTQNQLVQLSEEKLQDPTLGCPDLRTTTKPPHRVWPQQAPKRGAPLFTEPLRAAKGFVLPRLGNGALGNRWFIVFPMPRKRGFAPAFFRDTATYDIWISYEEKILGC